MMWCWSVGAGEGSARGLLGCGVRAGGCAGVAEHPLGQDRQVMAHRLLAVGVSQKLFVAASNNPHEAASGTQRRGRPFQQCVALEHGPGLPSRPVAQGMAPALPACLMRTMPPIMIERSWLGFMMSSAPNPVPTVRAGCTAKLVTAASAAESRRCV